jgi:hypothetical protein
MDSRVIDSACSVQPTKVKLEPVTFDHIASSEIWVHYQSCQERVAVKCLTCQQQLWVKDKEGCLRLSFRKGQESNGLYRGYLISAEVPKSKQTKQVV